MSKNNEPVELYVAIARTTDMSILIHCEGKDAWLPKSQIKDYDDTRYDRGYRGHMEIPYWLAFEEGLI